MHPLRQFGALLLALSALVATARAEEPAGADAPMLLKADNLAYDQERDLVIATGRVEAVQGGRILLADEVRYHQPSETVTAAGNVSLLEKTGEVLFADYIELTGPLREGVIKSIRLLLTDGSRIAANGARRTGGNVTEMRKAVFSPCALCEDDPERAPLWQIKAIKVVHDQEEQVIEYQDAWLEFFGLPVAYTPYFSHPDPTVKRRSGFLIPRYTQSGELGVTVTTPYFWAISESRDLTISPTFTTEERVLLSGEYRENAGNGTYALKGAITRVDRRNEQGDVIPGDDTRGYIAGDGIFSITPVWQWGFDFARATDDTFLSRYSISSEDTLTSNTYVQAIDDRRFFSADFLAFQGLEVDDDPDESPLILPLIDYRFSTNPNRRTGQWNLGANALVLQRKEGTDTRRLTLQGGWTYRGVGSAGDLYSVNLNLRGDGFWVENVPDPGDPVRTTFDGTTGRLWPTATFDWRYPFISQSGGLRQIVEPLVQFAVSPNGGNSEKIPNEDSLDFEFDDIKLFSANRFTGFDRVEGGQRLNYGLNWSLHGPLTGSLATFFGQSYRVNDDDTFREGSGLEDNFSDFVGRVDLAPNEYFDVLYRFRLSKDNLSPKRNEVQASLGPSFFKFNVNYLSLDTEVSRADQPAFDDREELTLGNTVQFTDYWQWASAWRTDLSPGGGTLAFHSGLTYEDECFLFRAVGIRSFTRDRDVRPDTTFTFQIAFKHLG